MAHAPPEAPQAQKSRSLPLLVSAAVVILGGAGVVGFFARGGDSHGAEQAEGAPPPAPEPVIVALDPFVLNLADPEGERYVRASVHVELLGEEGTATIEPGVLQLARVRDRILTSLSSKAAEDVTSFEGRETLRGELRRTIAPLFADTRVVDVYFTEFLVQ